MKLAFEIEEEKMRFGDVPSGSYFWYEEELYLKPTISNCIEKLRNEKLALDIEDNMLTAFTSNDVLVTIEPKELKVTYC